MLLCAGCRKQFPPTSLRKIPMRIRPGDQVIIPYRLVGIVTKLGTQQVPQLSAHLCSACELKCKLINTEPAQWWASKSSEIGTWFGSIKK